MKTKLCILCFLLLLTTACKKDHQSLIQGTVRHAYTNAGIEGICVGLFVDCGEPMNCSRPLIAWAYTDAGGNFEIPVDRETSGNMLQTIQLAPFDSTSNMFRYMTKIIAFPVELHQSGYYINVQPSGAVVMRVPSGTWTQINADTVIVESPYAKDMIINGITDFNEAMLFVDPSRVNTFTWYYIKNGIQSSPVTKDIFVPNYYKQDTYYPVGEQWLLYDIVF